MSTTLSAALIYVFWPRIDLLSIRDVETGGLRWCAEMEANETFVISYTHSVNKRPVHDTLRVQGDHLVIVKSRFDTFGAGMPEASTDQGSLTITPDGWMEWTVNRPVPEVVIRVGRVAEHSLTLKGRRLRLTDLADPGRALLFQPQKSSLFNVLKGRCIRD